MANTLEIDGLSKTFRLHNQGGVEIAALGGIDLAVKPGECVVLSGPSGAGKSTVLRCVYGNYAVEVGRVRVRYDGGMVDVGGGHHRLILALRRRTIGYVSQFLRVVPRVATLDVVAEPALRAGLAREAARERARELLDALAIPQRMWGLAPQTFSGGEQQRVNIARGFAFDYDLLLLDEPTASLDAANRRRVARLIDAAKARGAAVLGIFHDADMAEAVGSRRFVMEAPVRAAA
jgi:alpha-D-ribose 1-methylphosphonate 5-triphosphate synthase subunit PhnL